MALWTCGARATRHVYSCDADVLVCGHHASELSWSADGGTIVPLPRVAEAHPKGVRGYIESCLYAFPEVSGFLVEGDVTIEGWELCNVPVRELRFAPEVECIGEGEFAVLDELRRLVIPAGVRMVESCAFQWCDKLTDLVIEGDLSRVAGWHEDAFRDCPCEGEYLELRRRAAAGEL